jgi:bidirectional [NiFe] hydrogenase diaphorase subunit
VRAAAHVCTAASCLASGGDRVLAGLDERLEALGEAADGLAAKRVGCLGLCSAGPLVRLPQTGDLWERVAPDDGERLDRLVAALAAVPDGATPAAPPGETRPFFARQVRVVTENCGTVDPESLDDYRAAGGWTALQRALHEMTPAQVLDEVTRSGLRGRGGAGYPTGLKWATVAKAVPRGGGTLKYVVCNADEGDPGAFMDRSILESDPHRVLEGMALAAYAVGASRGYVYCRAEYPLAVSRLRTAIRLARRADLLGTSVLDSRFDFDIDVRLGAGAFVCGEETALMASIRGGRGTPRPRPPYPAEAGLDGAPTLINNVETFGNVPWIVRHGGDAYAALGTGRSRGTKVFALAGRVVRTGLVEVPMGVTLRDIVMDIGGGVPDGRPVKAVQTGGPSGGCIPADLLDMPVDYESLRDAGSIMGSGGMIVMDDTSCMVDVAAYFMDFCRDESCGKCVPCRVGTTQMWTLLHRMTRGRATRADLDQLERLGRVVQAGSLCGLGQSAPNAVFSTLRYFRDEYLAHVDDRRCPAGVCDLTGDAGEGSA